MTSERRRYEEKLWNMSRTAFANHELVEHSGPGRWMLMRRHKDGGWDGNLATEVVSMFNRAIVVGGDISPVVFAYGPKEPVERVFWMGRSTSLGYIQEKAHIGMTSGRLVEAYEQDVAADDLASEAKDRLRELGLEGDELDREMARLLERSGPYAGDCDHKDPHVRALIEARNWYSENEMELSQFLYHHHEANFESETIYRIGMVVAPRVFYAQAALAKLCDLLEARQAA